MPFEPERGFKQIACELLDISTRSYSNFSKQKRPIIKLLEKYFTKEDLEEFIEIGKITRIEDNKEQELLNNEASKIYNHFISSLYLKDKTILELFLIVINNANITSTNLNLNFIDLVFETEGKKEYKIHLIKEFSKISQNSNILFFYSIKYMLQKKFEKVKFENPPSKGIELSFIITYIQFSLKIFYKKEFLSWKEFEKNQIFHIIDDRYDLSTEIKLYNDNKFDSIKFINRLEEYISYLQSLITKNDNLRINFTISQND